MPCEDGQCCRTSIDYTRLIWEVKNDLLKVHFHFLAALLAIRTTHPPRRGDNRHKLVLFTGDHIFRHLPPVAFLPQENFSEAFQIPMSTKLAMHFIVPGETSRRAGCFSRYSYRWSMYTYSWWLYSQSRLQSPSWRRCSFSFAQEYCGQSAKPLLKT